MKKTNNILEKIQNELFQKNGKGWFRIISGSMRPLIDIHDRVLVNRITPLEVKKGDIILFKSDNVFVTHRVTGFSEENGKRMILQKGDAGDYAMMISPEAVMGKVILIEKNGKFIDLESRKGRVINAIIFKSAFVKKLLKNGIKCSKSLLKTMPGYNFIRTLYHSIKKALSFLSCRIIHSIITIFSERGKSVSRRSSDR
jgi:signal peptidase I